MKIKIPEAEYKYLSLQLSIEEKELFKQLEDGKLNHNLFELDEETIYLIRDWCGERLQRIGFDKDYGVNKEGAQLESLIDLLYV